MRSQDGLLQNGLEDHGSGSGNGNGSHDKSVRASVLEQVEFVKPGLLAAGMWMPLEHENPMILRLPSAGLFLCIKLYDMLLRLHADYCRRRRCT